MTTPSPLEPHLAQAGAELAGFGEPEHRCRLVGVLGSLELEYAALRSSCVLIDRPDLASITVAGSDRVSFLNNMLTQELGDFAPGRSARAFWLNRQGRIVSDLDLRAHEEEVRLVCSIQVAAETASSLDAFVIADDVEIRAEPGRHTLQLSGPTAPLLLQDLTGAEPPTAGSTARFESNGVRADVCRDDALGVPTFWIECDATDAPAIYGTLVGRGQDPNAARIGEEGAALDRDDGLANRIRLLPAGWHAYNIARIEAGLPLFGLDFGGKNLPGESGILDERVSFTKGCYLGQEVVARMKSLGNPKQTVVALRLEASGDDAIPETGADVTSEDKVVGAITSATISPLLGGEPIALAMVKWGHHEPGSDLTVGASSSSLKATVQERLRFA